MCFKAFQVSSLGQVSRSFTATQWVPCPRAHQQLIKGWDDWDLTLINVKEEGINATPWGAAFTGWTHSPSVPSQFIDLLPEQETFPRFHFHTNAFKADVSHKNSRYPSVLSPLVFHSVYAGVCYMNVSSLCSVYFLSLPLYFTLSFICLNLHLSASLTLSRVLWNLKFQLRRLETSFGCSEFT